MSFLLDTDICSAHLKGHPIVTSRCHQYTGQLHASAVTVAELYTWALRSKSPASRSRSLDDFLCGVTLLNVDRRIAEKFGEIRARLLDHGRSVAGMDLLIAATALIHDLTLVTHNTIDFRSIPDLRLSDWIAP